MPIKLPKGFARRKSSGNVLEEFENFNPPGPSFKVFERPGGGSRSFDGENALKRMSQGRPLSSPRTLDDDELFPDVKNETKNRGSGGTDKSASTGGLYDSSASSARFSSSSTLPSSTDIPAYGDNNLSLKRALQDIPAPRIAESKSPLSLRAKAGRTFSFGIKAPKSSPITSSRPGTATFVESPTVVNITRDRAMTASTASTATPPKLLDADLSFDSDTGDFSNLFDNFNTRRTPPLEKHVLTEYNSSSPSYGSSPIPPIPSKYDYYNKSGLVPSPINVDRTRPVESSPYSWGSQHSQEGLMSSSSPPVAFSPELPSIPRKSLPVSRSIPLPDSASPSIQSRPGFGAGLRRSSAYSGRRRSTPIEDEDARLVPDSALDNRRSFLPPPSSFRRNSPPQAEARNPPAAVIDSDDGDIAGTSAWREEPSEQTPRPQKSVPYPDAESPAHLDASLAANARLVLQYEERAPSPSKGNNKIMTPAQFERYRRQQELTRTRSDASNSDASASESDNYDDEDETERNRQAAKQRRKQEAHLAVYRQQMMKMTGEQSADLPNLGGTDKISMSTPNLPGRLSTLGLGNEKVTDGGKASDEEDEDVPLGILAAHGFPNRNRPPTRLSSSGPSASLRAPSHHGPGSVMSESTAQGPRGALPVFARHLPQDPYYGASLVNASNRENLAMNGGVPQGQTGAPPGIPPGGLVGVIAGEERARAIRRGSPNAQSGYEPPSHPGMQRSQTMGNMSMMGMPGMPGMPPMLSPGEQAQIQTAQQVNQMMQMQMQWMQQMSQMMGMQGGQMPPMPPAPPGMNNFLAPPGQMQRPMSMGADPGPSSPGLQQDQRAMSFLDPGASQWGRRSMFAPSMNGGPADQGYAPSIAPSERSNIGMASRYRPVSTAVPPPDHKAGTRASTFTSASFQTWNQPQQQMQVPKSQSSSTIKAASSNANRNGSDDDDDEGWAEMKKKRDRKRSTWKMRKGQNALRDVFHVGS